MTEPEGVKNPDEPTTVQGAKRLFDESVARIDGATLSRLNRQRQAALAELRAGTASRRQFWLPAAGSAALLAATLFLWQAQDVREAPPEAVTDLDILMDGESLEMLEDLEFYAWLEAQEPAPPADDHVG